MEASDRRRRATEEAAAWWVRFRAGELQRSEREEFVDWLRESAVHVAEMLRIARLNDSLDQFRGWLQITAEEGQAENSNIIELAVPSKPASALDSPPSARRRPWLGVLATSAVLLVLVAVGHFINVHAQVIETERGERREVALSDGTVLEIDPETRLRVAFEEHRRLVYLDHGRALFKVAKNPVRPFLVAASSTTVRAVGTAFGVEHLKQRVVVTVAEGQVGVFLNESSVQAFRVPSTTGSQEPQSISVDELLLTAGQQVNVPASASPRSVRRVDSARALAWAKGQLVFDDEKVIDAVEEFNRYNRIQLRVVDTNLAARTVSAIFDSSDIESFIEFLQTEQSVQVTRTGGEIILK